MALITIDPLTRIEGHLKVDVDVNNGAVTEASVSGTMARGIEELLIGKDSRDAPYVTERLCGVCFTAHGWTSSLAVEQAHGLPNLPEAARLLRNLIAGGAWLHDHPLHFYHLSAVDYLDMTVLANYSGSDPYLNKIKDLVISEVSNPPIEGGWAGPFVPTYAPDQYSITDLDTVGTLVQHYVKALEIQAKAKKMSAIFGGKQPHQSAIFPTGVGRFPTSSQRDQFMGLLDEITTFIREVYVPDVLSLGTNQLLDLATSDVGVGHQNYLSYGCFPYYAGEGNFLYPEGAIINGSLVATDRATIEQNVTEDVTNSWYNSNSGGSPNSSQQDFNLDKNAYSFVKAPRYQGQPMEVGPLARMMVAASRTDHPAYNHEAVQTFIGLLNQGVKPGVVARHAARALETLMICDGMYRWMDELNAMPSSSTVTDKNYWDPPSSGSGLGMTEAPRGALGHWMSISGSKISHYAMVVPTTWNASPKDASGIRGPYEEALLGCPVPDENNPINVGRVIRSFDPCLACAVHIIAPNGDMKKYRV